MILLGLALMAFGNYLSERLNKQTQLIKRVIVATPVTLLVMISLTGHYRDMVWYTMYEYLPNTLAISREWKSLYKEIQNSNKEDVVIEIPAYYLGTILMTPQFGDKDNYVNVTAAKYFGKKSLTVNVDWERLFYD